MCNSKAAEMNMQCSLVKELMLYKFKLGHNTAKATKIIYWAKVKAQYSNEIQGAGAQLRIFILV